MEVLAGKQLLLVLDNCEHLVKACAQLAETLLSLSGVSLLATSREPLGIAGEIRYPLAPLALPPPGYQGESSLQYDAIRLFVERARRSCPSST